MISTKKYLVVQRILLLGGMFLVLYFFLVFLPFSDRVEAMDRPLEDAWYRLARTRLVETSARGVSLAPLDQRLHELEMMSLRLGHLSNALTRRISLDAATRDKVRQPFQLVDFQNERQLRQEQLQRLAAEKGVAVAPAAVAGYPEYNADLKNPELLWAQLTIVQEILKVAAINQVSNIASVTVRPVRPVRSVPGDEAAAPFAFELPVSVQVAGSAASVIRFLNSLPLRADEAGKLGLGDLAPGKPALFLERILMRKETPEKPDQVRVDARITALVYRNP